MNEKFDISKSILIVDGHEDEKLKEKIAVVKPVRIHAKEDYGLAKPAETSSYDLVIKRLNQLVPTDITKDNLVEFKKVLNEFYLLYKMSRTLIYVFDLDSLLQQIMNLIFEEIDAECGFILLFDEETGKLVPRCIKYRDDAKVEKNKPIEISKTIINKIVNEKVSVLTSDALKDFPTGKSLILYNIRSAISVPLLSREKIIGVIHLDNRTIANLFNERDLDLLTVISNQISVLIDNAQLYKKLESKVNLANKELKEINNLLILARERIQSVIESMIDPVVVIDKNKKIILFNEKSKNILPGISIGDDVTDIIKNYPLLELFSETLSKGISSQKEIIFNLPEGEKVFRTIVSSIKQGWESIGAVAVFADVTKFKEMDDLKNEFVSHVSHELRTPLTSIKAYLEILTDGITDEQWKKYLNIIDEETDRLTRLIEDLLIVSRIESKKLKLNLKSVPIKKIIDKVIAILNPKFEEKKQTVVLELSEKAVGITCDEDKIGEVLINIVGNALKYTQEGGKIEIAVSDEDEQICIRVKDNGIGMSLEDQQNLFQKFFRSERREVRDIGGTGLGLYISKQLIEAHCGEISVQSNLGKGSSFIVKLQKYN